MTTGYLGWSAGNSNTSIFLNPGSTYNTLGYPATTMNGNPVYDQGYRMWHMQGYFDYFGTSFGYPNVVYHNNQGFKGLSGSNTYLFQNNQRYVMAILSHGADPPSTPSSYTGHVRLNDFLGNFIFTYAPEVGLENEAQNNIKVYPNPASEKLFINSDYSIRRIEIISASGIQVKSVVLVENNMIHVGDLPGGLYCLKIFDESNNIHYSKFVK